MKYWYEVSRLDTGGRSHMSKQETDNSNNHDKDKADE